jgi:hypothetical protein
LQSHPHKYTAWFHIAFPQLIKWMDKKDKI